MFDLFSWSHIVILLTVALVVVGPKDLPRLMNMAGKWAGKARAMANEFRKSFDEMARQAELDELRKEIEDLKKNSPVSDIADQVNAMNASLNDLVAPMVDGAGQAESTAPVEGHIEPRAGEFEVTDTAAHPAEPAPAEPAAEPAHPAEKTVP